MRINKRKLKVDLKRTIVEIEKYFPFNDYIDASHYYEMYAVLKEIGNYLPDFRDKKLLDIGCGPMDKTGVFQLFGFNCSSVDDLNDPWHLRGDNIKKIKNYAKRLGINFFHQDTNDYSIPFDMNSFDVVCSNAVIEHLHESPRSILNSMGNFVKPDGLIIITMPNSVNLKKRLKVLFGNTNYPPVDMFFNSIGSWRGHVREYTLKETIYICEAAGFEVLSAVTFEHLAYQKLPAILRQIYLFWGLLFRKFRSGLLVICKKPKSWKPLEPNEEFYRKALAVAVPKGVA